MNHAFNNNAATTANYHTTAILNIWPSPNNTKQCSCAASIFSYLWGQSRWETIRWSRPKRRVFSFKSDYGI